MFSMILAEINVFFGAVQKQSNVFKVFSFVLLGGTPWWENCRKCLPHIWLLHSMGRCVLILFLHKAHPELFSMAVSEKKIPLLFLIIQHYIGMYSLVKMLHRSRQKYCPAIFNFTAGEKGLWQNVLAGPGRASFLPPSVRPSCHFFPSCFSSLFPPLSTLHLSFPLFLLWESLSFSPSFHC